jgi:transcription-repair coupling factor (superfamily II helicase)
MMPDTISPLDGVDLPQPNEKKNWTNLYGTAKWMAVSKAASESLRPFVVFTSDIASALKIEQELRFFDPRMAIHHYPDWETLPYDRFSPYQDIISERLTTLSLIPDFKKEVLIVAVQTAMHRIVPGEWLALHSFSLVKGEVLDRDKFRKKLIDNGYRSSPQVSESGEYAIRGSLIDVFPVGSLNPIRIDFFDNEIETLRFFDVETQRSTKEVNEIRVLPGKEFLLDQLGISQFRREWRTEFGQFHDIALYQDVSDGLPPPGIEYYLPLFHDRMELLMDYFSESTICVFDENVEKMAGQFWTSVESRYDAAQHDTTRPVLEPRHVFCDFNELLGATKKFGRVFLTGLNTSLEETNVFATSSPLSHPIDARAKDPLALIRSHVERTDGRILFLADSLGRREAILDLLRDQKFSLKVFDTWKRFIDSTEPIGITVAAVEDGTEIDNPRMSLITESQLFGKRLEQRDRRKKRNNHENIIKNLTELRLEAPVVHEHHGVGRYQGLEVLNIGNIESEFIKLEYRDGDKLYVPVASLELISRYSGSDPDTAPLHKLGTEQWSKARRKASEKIRDIAAELLELHAKRALRKGHAFEFEKDAYNSFVQAFPFEETPDQLEAVHAVLEDMGKEQPMDRLICGDVGFGKTEVALRAAFVAVNDGYQVAVLVPTTLLANQHYETFCDRFAEWPVRVEQLSRFRNIRSTKDTLEGMSNGKVDIVIGTHKLLNKSVDFFRLGLLVIDEEHRFGVDQKEKIKSLRADVDILTLTATPIPRTLNMALSGTRELSIIATPPLKRLAVKTFLSEWSAVLLREAILRELGRGGQVYFVHNKVETIDSMVSTIQEIVPEARLACAHGKMREKELERVMLDFYHGRCNVLVCSTIIETGLDISNANTIIINHADRFGLAQLYQLRGRVGRSHHRAYAYLVVPHADSMTPDAVKRLEAISSIEELGMGFTLASHDLEIRGAGEILGDEQSGHIQEIGFSLYSDLLNRAMTALKSGRQIPDQLSLEAAIEVNLNIPALIPDNYLPDVHARLVFYKRISGAENTEALEGLREEMIDRLGLFDDRVENLFTVAALKMEAKPLGIKRIDFSPRGGKVEFHPEPNIEPINIIKLVQSGTGYSMADGQKLKLIKAMPDVESRVLEVRSLLKRCVGL